MVQDATQKGMQLNNGLFLEFSINISGTPLTGRVKGKPE